MKIYGLLDRAGISQPPDPLPQDKAVLEVEMATLLGKLHPGEEFDTLTLDELEKVLQLHSF